MTDLLTTIEPPAERPGTTPEQPIAAALHLKQDADKSPEFDWFAEQECIVLERQASIAVYRNARDHVVIRSESTNGDDEDTFVILATVDAVRVLIAALQRELKGGGK